MAYGGLYGDAGFAVTVKNRIAGDLRCSEFDGPVDVWYSESAQALPGCSVAVVVVFVGVC